MSSLSTKFNKLSNDLNMKLIKGNRKFILDMKSYINNGENLRKKTYWIIIKNKQIACCSILLFGIVSFSSYVDIESMNIISSDMNMNEYKLLGTKSKEIANALKILKMSLFLGLLKKLKEQDKLKSDDIENELIKYIESNITKLRYMMIKEIKDGLKKLGVKKIRIT